MKLSRIATTLFAGALLLSAGVFAKESNNNKGTLRLDDNVTVDGTPLQPGNYKVEWNGNGPDVQVTLLQGSRTIATFPAHLAQQASASASDAYESSSQANGDKTLKAIYFGGKHYSLEVAPTAAQQNAPNNPSASR